MQQSFNFMNTDGTMGKPMADYYIDDKMVFWQDDWVSQNPYDTEKEALAKLQEMNANQTSNFVVFPQYQDLLKIKEINDKPLGAYK